MPPTVLLSPSTRRAAAGGWAWTEKDTLLAAALIRHEDSLCPGCGQPTEESMDPAADPDKRDGQWRYEVGPPHRCHACTAIAHASKPYLEPPGKDQAAVDSPQALRWQVQRTPRQSR
jgi:hypothetical protein